MRLFSTLKSRLMCSAALVLVSALMIPAAASASYTTSPEPIYASPAPWAWNGESTLPYWSLAMQCWTDSYWVAGSNRWFLVYGTGFTGSNIGWVGGWLPANEVHAQTTVRHC